MTDAVGERRQMTVVFTDLVDSTSIASRLDPEDWHDLLEAYHSRVAEVIQGHGGFVAQFQGDGVVAYFGWPVASDLASRDAVVAGLQLVEAVPAVTERVPGYRGPRLAARVGIHAGVVVVASARSGGVVRPADVFGDTPSVAARLQGAAEPGQVVISGAVAALTEGWFEVEPRGPTALKGLAEPIEILQVLRPTGALSRLDTRLLTAFVGRGRELSILNDYWADALSGTVRRVRLSGEGGIGKSRLVYEFQAHTAQERDLLLVLQCTSRDRLSPLQPFFQLMGRVPSTAVEAAEWINSTVAQRRALLVVEDAHWADPSTIEALGLLGVRSPLLVVITSRPESNYPEGPGMPMLDHEILLEALAAEDALAIVDEISSSRPLPQETRDRLVERGGGVPLFLEELARSTQEDAGFSSSWISSIPMTLSGTVTSRLDRLGDAKRVAQHAAVIGQEFGLPVLAELVSVDDSKLGEPVALLLERGIIEASGGAPTYHFRHALLHEAAYDSLLRRERRTAHSRVADVLSRQGERPEVLAAHLGLAGRAVEAIGSWEQAARRAARSTRFKEAAAHLHEAVALLADVPDGDERDAMELRIRTRLGQYMGSLDQADPEVGLHLRRSVELATGRGDGMMLLEATLTLAAHYQALADYPAVHQALDRADEVAVAYRVPFLKPIVALLRGPVLVWQGQLRLGRETLTAAMNAAGFTDDGDPQQALSISGLIVDVAVGALVVKALGDWLSGQTGSDWGRKASQLAEAKGSVHAQCLSLATRAIIHQMAGEPAFVRRLAAQASELAVDQTTKQFRAWADALLQWADGIAPEISSREDLHSEFMRPYLLSLRAERLRDSERAVRLLDEALIEARRTGELFGESHILRIKGDRLSEMDRTEEAIDAYHEAIQVARDQGAAALAERARLAQIRLVGPTRPWPG